jgi:hypothetical protein
MSAASAAETAMTLSTELHTVPSKARTSLACRRRKRRLSGSRIVSACRCQITVSTLCWNRVTSVRVRRFTAGVRKSHTTLSNRSELRNRSIRSAIAAER